MNQNTYKKYIYIFMCAAIVSILVFPVSVNNSAFAQVSGCIKNSNVDMAMGADMPLMHATSTTCVEAGDCDTDLCAGSICSSVYLFVLPENHDLFVVLNSYTNPFSFLFVIHPEPLGSFQRPPITS